MKEAITNDKALVSSENSQIEDQYFIVSASKLATLHILTLGLYAVYWFYKNWKLQQPLMTQRIKPPLRAFFYIFFTHSLFQRISNSIAAKNMQLKFNAGLLATAFVGLMLASNISGNLADKPTFPAYLNIVWLITFLLSVYPLQEAQDAINQLSNDPLGLKNAKYSWKNILAMIVGGIFWLAILLSVAVQINKV